MKPVKIYTTTYCGYCAQAKALLVRKGIPFDEVDVTANDDLRVQLVEMSGGQRTVPQIFIGSVHVGGYRDLAKLEADGKLDEMVK